MPNTKDIGRPMPSQSLLTHLIFDHMKKFDVLSLVQKFQIFWGWFLHVCGWIFQEML